MQTLISNLYNTEPYYDRISLYRCSKFDWMQNSYFKKYPLILTPPLLGQQNVLYIKTPSTKEKVHIPGISSPGKNFF